MSYLSFLKSINFDESPVLNSLQENIFCAKLPLFIELYGVMIAENVFFDGKCLQKLQKERENIGSFFLKQ